VVLLVAMSMLGTGSAAADGRSASVPAVVVRWAQEKGPSAVEEFLRDDPQMRAEMYPDGGAVTLGAPTREVLRRAPAYDLESDTVTSSLAPEELLVDTGTYVMRLVVDGHPVDGEVEVSVNKHGNVSLDSFGGAFTLLPGVSGDLGRYTYVEVVGGGAYDWDARSGELTPLDEPASAAVDGAPTSLRRFATALGKRYAERAAQGSAAAGAGSAPASESVPSTASPSVSAPPHEATTTVARDAGRGVVADQGGAWWHGPAVWLVAGGIGLAVAAVAAVALGARRRRSAATRARVH